MEKSLTEKIKEAGLHTIIYGIGSSLQALLGLIFIPIYTKEFSTEEYGILTLILLVGTISGSFFFFGGTSALARSYYDYEDLELRKGVVTTSLIITSIGATLQVLLGFLFSDFCSVVIFDTDRYSSFIVASLVFSSLSIVNNLFLLILRYERKSVIVTIINISQFVFSIVLILLLLFVLEQGIMAAILGPLIVSAAILLFSIFYCFRYLGLQISAKEVSLQLKFGLFSVLIGINQFLLNSADKFLINHYGSLDDVGIYSLGFRIGSVMNVLLIVPFSLIWAPMRMEYHNDKNSREMTKTVITYYFLIGSFFTVILSLFAKEAIILLSSNNDYYTAFKIVPIILLSVLIFGSINIFDIGIFISRKVYINAIILFIGFLLYTFINMQFLSHLGYMFAAYSLLFVNTIIIISVSIISKRIYDFTIEKKRLVRIFLGLFITLIFAVLDEPPVTYDSVLIKVVILLLFILYIYTAILNKQEKQTLSTIIRRFIPV